MMSICFYRHQTPCRLIAIVLIPILLAGCRTVELTGRRQLLLVPESNEMKLGASAFQETLAEERPSENRRYVEMVNRVGQRIAAVANRPEYDWEFKLIASPQQNAFCLPGGKVAIYEGILPVCQNEAGLAVVMSHEIAHALARHGGERMSQGYLVNGVGTALSVVLQNQEQVLQQRVAKAYGLASEYGFVLPYSRKHESEADHMGLMLMAKAGYDPSEAPAFWQRFSTSQGSPQQPEFLSTHPADERRSQDLAGLLPEAIQIYGTVAQRYGKGEPIGASRVAQSNGDSTSPSSSPNELPLGGSAFAGQQVGYEKPLSSCGHRH